MNSKELSSQLRKPTGESGRELANALNESNRGLYDLAFDFIALNSGDQLLEIGFGNGKHFPEYFDIHSNLMVYGVDFSPDMCQEARTHNSALIESGKLSIHCAETFALPYSIGMFDLVVAINVIYFLDPPEIHLNEIRRVLQPDGYFLIGYRPRHSVKHLDFTKQNFTLYELEELIELLNSNGFNYLRDETKTYRKKDTDGKDYMVTDSVILAQVKA